MDAEEPDITADTVREAAKLSRIAVDDAEVERMRGQLAALLGYVSQLQELDVDGVEPTGHPIGLTMTKRADAVQPSGNFGLIPPGADGRSEGFFFFVPKVIGRGDA